MFRFFLFLKHKTHPYWLSGYLKFSVFNFQISIYSYFCRREKNSPTLFYSALAVSGCLLVKTSGGTALRPHRKGYYRADGL